MKKNKLQLTIVMFIIISLFSFFCLYIKQYKQFNKQKSLQLVEFEKELNFLKDVKGYLIKDRNDNLIIVNARDGVVSKYLLRDKIWEESINKLVNKVVKKGDKILNFGAHIGFYTLNMSKLIGSDGHIYAFEANPLAYDFLKMNLAINNINNTTIYNKAVYSINKSISFKAFNENGQNQGGSYLIPPHGYEENENKNGNKLLVEAIKIDDMLSNISKIDLIQMDIEGCEAEAVYGAQNLISRSPDLVVIQEWSNKMMSRHSDVKRYIKFWRDKGYNFALIDGYAENNILKELTDEDLLSSPGINVVIAKNISALGKE